MDDPNAALAEVQALGQKTGEQMPGLVAVQAMQVDFVLDHPAPAPQIAQDVLGQTVAQVMRLVTAFKAVLQGDETMQAFMQRRTFVGDVLQWVGWWWPLVVLEEV